MGHPPPPSQPPWSTPPPFGRPPADQPPFARPPADQPPFALPSQDQPPYGLPYGPPPGASPHPEWPVPPGQPGQPAYGPPAPPRRGGGTVIGIVVAVVAAVAVLCGGGGAIAYVAFLRGDSPDQVVADYLEAARNGDCDGMVDRMTESAWRQGGAASRGQAVSQCRDAMAALGGDAGQVMSVYDVQLVSEDRGVAVVEATIETPGPVPGAPSRQRVRYTLRTEDRQWRIDSTDADLGLAGFDPPDLPEVPEPEPPDPAETDPGSPLDPDPSTPAPLTSDELYSAPSYTFRITLSERVLEGELVRIQAYDHTSCDAAALTEPVRSAMATCQNRIEAAYVGGSEDLWVTQQVLMFTDVASAEAFYRLLENDYAGDLISFEDPGNMDGSGYLASRIGQREHFVVLTLMASSSGSEAAIQAAKDHAHARHAESMSYFIWR